MSPECTNEIKALAHGPLNAYSYSACIVNGVRFVARTRDDGRTTQNSGVVSIGEDDTPFYGQLEDIIELNYLSGYSVVLFRCKWFDTSGKGLLIDKDKNMVFIDVTREWYKGKTWYDDIQYILATQAKQVFYLRDPSRNNNWRVVEEVHHRKLWDHPSMSAISEIDVLHDNRSSDYNLVVNEDCEVGESSAQLIDDETDTVPVQTNLDESFINDDDDEEQNDDEDEEDEVNDDEDDNNDDDDGNEDIYHSSDDSD
jgi:hypothetical protein